MKHYIILIPVLFLFLLQSCHQLNMEDIEEPDTADDTDITEYFINDGETGRINILFGETSSILIKTSDIQHSGYFKVTLTKASQRADYLYPEDIVFRVYDNAPHIGNSLYSVVTDKINSEIFEYYFISDGNDKDIVLYHEDMDNIDLNVYDFSISSVSSPVITALNPYTPVVKTAAPGASHTETVNYWGTEIVYLYTLENLNLFQDYALTVKRDDNTAILPGHNYFNSRISATESFAFEIEFYKYFQNADIYFFRVIPRNGQTEYGGDDLYVSFGEFITGESVGISLEEIVLPDFSDDVFEPDQGPLAVNCDVIDTAARTSNIHSLSETDNLDWITFQPWGAGDYTISLQLEDALYLSEMSDEFEYEVYVSLINQNGAEVVNHDYFRFYGAPVNPVLSPDIISYTLETDNGDPMYIKISASEALKYRVIVNTL